jgi:hypothetical protein
MSAVVEDLEKDLCSCVFIDILLLFRILVEMKLGSGIF